MIKIPLDLHTSCSYGGNYRFNDQLKRSILLEFLTRDKIISHFFGLRDEDWASSNIEPYLYLKGFNGKFVLKVNSDNRETLQGDYSTKLFSNDYKDITIDLYYRPFGFSNTTNEEYISYLTIYPNEDEFEKDMHTGYNLFPPAYLCVIPIDAKCTAFIFTYNSMLLPAVCLIVNEKNNEKYLSIFGYQCLTMRKDYNDKNWLELGPDYSTPFTNDSQYNKIYEYFYIFYDTKSNNITKNKTSKTGYQLGDVLKPSFFAYDNLNVSQLRDFYPFIVGDNIIPGVYIVNGGANLSLYLRETLIDNISYYSLFNNILIKNNDVDNLLLDNPLVAPVRDFEIEPLDVCLFQGQIGQGSSGLQIVLNNFNEKFPVLVKVYKNDVLYDQWTLPHVNQALPDFTVNNIIFNSYAGESSHIVRGDSGDTIKIMATINDLEILKRISYNYTQTVIGENNIKAPSALTDVILNTKLYGDSNRIFQLKRTGAGEIYYTTVFPFYMRSDLMGYGSGTCFLLLSQTSSELDNIYWQKTEGDSSTFEWVAKGLPFYHDYYGANSKDCIYGKTNIFTIKYKNETWYGRLVYAICCYQQYTDTFYKIYNGAFFGLDNSGQDSYDYYMYALSTMTEKYKDSEYYKYAKYTTLNHNRRKEDLSDIYLIPSENTSVFWQLPCYSGVTEIHHKIFENNYNTGMVDPQNAFSPEAAYNLITMIKEWKKPEGES